MFLDIPYSLLLQKGLVQPNPAEPVTYRCPLHFRKLSAVCANAVVVVAIIIMALIPAAITMRVGKVLFTLV